MSLKHQFKYRTSAVSTHMAYDKGATPGLATRGEYISSTKGCEFLGDFLRRVPMQLSSPKTVHSIVRKPDKSQFYKRCTDSANIDEGEKLNVPELFISRLNVGNASNV